ncbi:MAG TPA: hypothetical protein VFM98_17580 [Ramlibacter sp.]|uniref:hypothetical protein n=1 Tax=Ramlibacter sp. TaxID=1917967 RepID=UPI002D7F8813|nr:hypothetical protein [Ramlibacter sp.]HET8747415.1 hypothetical protein [Ramlibacter sp.]
MSRRQTVSAVARFACVAVACVAAASLWAQARPETGLLLDAQTWREEVVTASTGPWPEEGWFRLVPLDQAVEVRAVKPSEQATTVAADALYFREPGVALKEGRRTGYRYPAVLQQPRMGVQHELSVGGTRFSLLAAYVDQGIRYTIAYAGESHDYVLGGPGADHTVVRAIADLDGDRQPDFVIDVDDGVYLLLSTRARPGLNAPTAHYTEQIS